MNRNGITAHRGNSWELPANSIAAIESAVSLGVEWIEIDVRRTKDHELILSHSGILYEPYFKLACIRRTTYSEIRKVDIAKFRRMRRGLDGGELPQMHAPLLLGVLSEAARSGNAMFSLHPKTDCIDDILAAIKDAGAEDRVGFNSMKLGHLMKIREKGYGYPLFWDRPPLLRLESNIRSALKYQIGTLVLHHAALTRDRVSRIHDAGLKAGAWTLNGESGLRNAINRGVDRIYTDNPGLLLKLIETVP